MYECASVCAGEKTETNCLQILKSFRLHELLNFQIRFVTIAKTKNSLQWFARLLLCVCFFRGTIWVPCTITSNNAFHTRASIAWWLLKTAIYFAENNVKYAWEDSISSANCIYLVNLTNQQTANRVAPNKPTNQAFLLSQQHQQHQQQ